MNKMQEGKKKFSIITVCQNEEKTLEKTIRSVIHQNYNNYEYIIIDGKSTDGTLTILELYSKHENIHIYSEKDHGIYNAMNNGLSHARGEYVFFLNSGDAFYDENVLKNISQNIERDASDIIIGSYIEKRHEMERVIRIEPDIKWEKRLRSGTGICHQAIFAKEECLKEGFNESYKIAADYDWLCRQFNAGFKLMQSDVIVSEYDVYGTSSLAKNWRSTKRECCQIVEKNFPDMIGKIENEIEQQYIMVKNQRMLECMNNILALKQRNRSLLEFFQNNSIKEVAIYGFYYLGQRLLAELNETDIVVKYIIDRDHSFHSVNVPFKFMDEELESVDAVIITPIFEFYNIKKQLKDRLQSQFISIEDIINSMY